MKKNYHKEECKTSNEKLEDFGTKIIEELRTITTHNQWSTLDAVLLKLNKKLPETITTLELSTFLQSISVEELNRNGIWVHVFDVKYIPIICINPSFGRANDKNGLERPCNCKIAYSDNDSKIFFNSHKYNAGRHKSNNSNHVATCSKWHPPTAGHLHSWRRGY